ncbi:hypothetical protein KUCAC02_020880 [Chaenocephalus aceratus]|uniref:Uncharacterized protein n=1 Tax=Chaenocephalus aceratus TaxID=36190 RepID=A0ACB9XFQ4_CHAAC|nr:hypothetical protein KUCAC02_020880 [Chaenocephalus aceratus]
MVGLQTKDILKVELRAGVGHFWSLVSEEDFPTLKPLLQKVMSFFVSTNTSTNYKYDMKKIKEMHACFRSSQY